MIRWSGVDIEATHAQLLAGPGSTAADLGFALVAEVRLLREQVDGYRMMIDGLENAAHEERAAVVAWLRGEPERLVKCNGHRHADGKPCWVMSPMPADELADCIERGEHRREEER